MNRDKKWLIGLYDKERVTFVIGWIEHIATEDTLIAFILNRLLPAIRDNKEFQDAFWAWMIEHEQANEYLKDGRDAGLTGHEIMGVKDYSMTKQMLLGYYLEYIKEVLA